MKKIPNRIYLGEEDLPKYWLNLNGVMKDKTPPMLNPATGKPATKEDLYPLFCRELVEQEFNTTDAYIPIPEPIRDFYKMYRPSPLHRAYALEKFLDTPAHVYYKYEGNNSSGSHKLNSALPQAYYNRLEGNTSLTTETGAGQWGTALSIACGFFKIPLTVYMVKGSYEQKPHRKIIMQVFDGDVVPSPSMTTEVGRRINADFPGTSGSLGCAISEAVERATNTPNCRYVLGSVLNQVLLHQSVIGLETKAQLETAGEYPDILVGCAGGGSNLGGFIAPFVKDKIDGTGGAHIIAVEPRSCPSLTRGVYAYDYCDTGHLTPLAKMYTLGSEFMPAPVHAGGLRYHGMSPIVSKLYHDGLIDEARAVPQTECFRAAVEFARCEAIVPAPESSHAINVAMQEARKCRETGEAKTIVFCLSGHGNLDFTAYDSFLNGSMTDYVLTDEDLAKSLAHLPQVAE